MHLDPDFEHLTYGDDGNRRGSDIKNLLPGDLLVFYAGLRGIRSPKSSLVYAIVGLYEVESVQMAPYVTPGDRHKNAHTRKEPVCARDIVVWAAPGRSGRLKKCIPIGEWRAGAYRVREDLLEAWGGLTVKDGFIQRSARPPRFKQPERFHAWFQNQGPELVARNNP